MAVELEPKGNDAPCSHPKVKNMSGEDIIELCEPIWDVCTSSVDRTNIAPAKKEGASYTPATQQDYDRAAAELENFNFAPAMYPVEGAGNEDFSNWYIIGGAVLAPLFVSLAFFGTVGIYSYLLLGAILFPLAFGVPMLYHSFFGKPIRHPKGLPRKSLEEYFEFHDETLKAAYAGRSKIPVETFFEAYFDEKLSIKGDMLKLLEARHDFFSFRFTFNQAKFFFTQWIPELLSHTRKQDEEQVQDHYDRGDDFYAAFLGPSMTYTSGISNAQPVKSPYGPGKMEPSETVESLELLQRQKIELVAKKLDLKENDKHLDIGCGWGTFAIHCAKHFKTESTGVTLSENQCAFARLRSKQEGVPDGKAQFLRMDYRDMDMKKYNKISCLEMAEHVGVRKFQAFLLQVREMLEDDGLFFLQIAGLRRAWQFEDFMWGLFMAKYVFPGADASCPLYWVVEQLERAGFEVSTVDTIGVHYSATILRWYINWLKNATAIKSKYGERWFRVWEFFLAYSTIISRQGSATCYQIVAHKNLNAFDRTRFVNKRLSASTI